MSYSPTSYKHLRKQNQPAWMTTAQWHSPLCSALNCWSRITSATHYPAHWTHTTLSHQDKKGSDVRLLLIDYNSAFNTTVPSGLVTELKDLGLMHVDPWLPDRWTPGCGLGPDSPLPPSSLTAGRTRVKEAYSLTPYNHISLWLYLIWLLVTSKLDWLTDWGVKSSVINNTL